jgi:diguanylate cyclase (GGDEF)-like protein
MLQDSGRFVEVENTGIRVAETAFDRYTWLASTALRAPMALISLSDHGQQRCISARGVLELGTGAREARLSRHLCEQVASSETPVLISDSQISTLAPGERCPELANVAYAGAPLLAAERQVLGALCVIDTKCRAWTDQEQGILRELAATVATELELRVAVSALSVRGREQSQAITRLLSSPPPSLWPRPEGTAMAERQIARQAAGASEPIPEENDREHLTQMVEALSLLAVMDDLTGLHNRRGFMALARNQIETARLTRRPLLMFFADLDGLKWVNDTWGHEAGDDLLRDTAALLRATFRETDVLGRLGGDEFIVLTQDAAPGDADRLAERLQAAVRTYNALPGRSFALSISTGATAYDPRRPEPLETLLKRADAAMYVHKQLRRSSERARQGLVGTGR